MVSILTISSAAGQEAGVATASGYLQLGGGYSSNLDIGELELATGVSDYGMLAEAGVDVLWRPRPYWRIVGGYSFSGSRYRDLDALDLSSHMIYVDASHDLDIMTVGANYYYTDASLDGDGFLELHQTSVYMGRMFNEVWYVRAALNFADKNFARIPQHITGGEFGEADARDADSYGFSVDGFWFFREGVTSLNVGYDYEEESTRADRFDYDAITFRTVLHHDISLLARNAVLKLGHRIQLRDYTHATPGIGRRDDTRNVVDANLTIQWAQNFDLIGTLERAMYESDLPASDYNENSIKLTGKLKF